MGNGDQGYDHRHLSHMIGIFPGDLIQTNEEWYEAARVSMNNRNDVNTGWSMLSGLVFGMETMPTRS